MFSLTWEEFLPVHPVLSGSWSCSTTSPIIPCSAFIWCHPFPGISTGALRACDKHAFLEQPSQWKKRIRILKSFTYTYTDGNAHTKTHKYVIHQKTKKKLIHDRQIPSIIHPNLWLWINQWKFTKCEKHLEYNFANLFTHTHIYNKNVPSWSLSVSSWTVSPEARVQWLCVQNCLDKNNILSITVFAVVPVDWIFLSVWKFVQGI